MCFNVLQLGRQMGVDDAREDAYVFGELLGLLSSQGKAYQVGCFARE